MDNKIKWLAKTHHRLMNGLYKFFTFQNPFNTNLGMIVLCLQTLSQVRVLKIFENSHSNNGRHFSGEARLFSLLLEYV